MADDDVKAPDFTEQLDPNVVEQIITGMTNSQQRPNNQIQQDVKEAKANQSAPTPTPDLSAASSSGQLPPEIAASLAANQTPPMPQGGIPYAQAKANEN